MSKIDITETNGTRIHTIRATTPGFDPARQGYTPRPIAPRCQHAMTGELTDAGGDRPMTMRKGKRIRCLNAATTRVDGIWYCEVHAQE